MANNGAKRARMDMLTGGTKDVNPQFISVRLTESSANTFTQLERNLPVGRVGMPNNRAQVIEVLKVWCESFQGSVMVAAGDGYEVAVATQTKAAIPDLDDPDVICKFARRIEGVAGGGFPLVNHIEVRDLTDGAGHGIIVATQSMFFTVIGSSAPGAFDIKLKVLYRFKNVSLQEFVGLAIQQQG